MLDRHYLGNTITEEDEVDAPEGEREIRELHDALLAASTANHLDASMAPISASIVSYEPPVPLQYTRRHNIREE